PAEGVDLAPRRPQAVLHDLLGVRRVAGDANRQAVDPIPVRAHEGLDRAGRPSAYLLHEGCVRIDRSSREELARLDHVGLMGPGQLDRIAVHFSLLPVRAALLAKTRFGIGWA